jgi:hypothetical protein
MKSSAEKKLIAALCVAGALVAAYFLTQSTPPQGAYEGSSVKEPSVANSAGANPGAVVKSEPGSAEQKAAEKVVAQAQLPPEKGGAGAAKNSQVKANEEPEGAALIDRAQKEKLLSTQSVFK